MDWRLRLAREDDIPALEALIPISVRALQAHQYSSAQMEARVQKMPGRGFEPLRIAPPDPKSGASANFATLATEF
jgi:hypothetical protein